MIIRSLGKSIILFLLLFLFVLPVSSSVSFAQLTPGWRPPPDPARSFSINLESSNYTTRDRIKINYKNATIGNCLALSIIKNGSKGDTYAAQPTESSLQQGCDNFSDPGAYAKFPITSSNTDGFTTIEPIPEGIYQINARQWKRDCFGVCGSWYIVSSLTRNMALTVNPNTSANYKLTLSFTSEDGTPLTSIKPTDNIAATAKIIQITDNSPLPGIMVNFTTINGIDLGRMPTNAEGESLVIFSFRETGLPAGNYVVKARAKIGEEDVFNQIPITIGNEPISGQPLLPTQGCKPGDRNCTSAGGEVCNIVTGNQAEPREDIDPVSGNKTIEYDDSETGEVIPHEKRGVFTALGCIPTQPQPLIEGILKFAFGIGGGIALLLMAYGAFQMITSGGNQDNVKKGSEQFTQAIIGLLFIIFSVLLLQIIGADILNIPGFKP